ncbi:MAG: phosphatidylglycerophosphatase A [Spirochaetia bacterium]|nr:phosphatidylglycerophosphatase A [Spirochaetia bacterium]
MTKIYELISTGFYIGYIRNAPGTFGSLTAVFIAFNIHQLMGINQTGFVLIAVITFIIGTFSVERFLRDTKEKDPGYVVIDEWAGQFTTYCFVPVTPGTLIIGFILFRFFDITKIYPINKSEKLKGSLGVMVDDVIAGLYAGIFLYLWYIFFKV